MKLALWLAMTASAGNLAGTRVVRANVTVAPLAASFASPLAAGLAPLSPSLAAPAAAPLPLPAPAPSPAAFAASAPRAPEAGSGAALAAAPPSAPSEGPGAGHAPGPAGEAPERAPEGSPSFVSRTLSALSRLANPFGGGRKPAEAPPAASESERLDREFSRLDLWAQAAPRAREEIAAARARREGKAAFQRYVQEEAAAAFERIKAARGVSNIGLHFNLHGGRRADYVGAGIRASMGDIALRYGGGDRNMKVYFFQTAQHHPFDALDASNGEILLFPTRMGHVLSFFDVDAPELLAGKADGRIKDHGAISMDFHGMRGVPYSAFLAPPLPVFDGSARKALGLGRLSRDEETLATLRYLEAALLAGGAFIPR